MIGAVQGAASGFSWENTVRLYILIACCVEIGFSLMLIVHYLLQMRLWWPPLWGGFPFRVGVRMSTVLLLLYVLVGAATRLDRPLSYRSPLIIAAVTINLISLMGLFLWEWRPGLHPKLPE